MALGNSTIVGSYLQPFELTIAAQKKTWGYGSTKWKFCVGLSILIITIHFVLYYTTSYNPVMLVNIVRFSPNDIQQQAVVANLAYNSSLATKLAKEIRITGGRRYTPKGTTRPQSNRRTGNYPRDSIRGTLPPDRVVTVTGTEDISELGPSKKVVLPDLSIKNNQFVTPAFVTHTDESDPRFFEDSSVVPKTQTNPKSGTRETDGATESKSAKNGANNQGALVPQDPTLPPCSLTPPKLVGRIKVWMEQLSYDDIASKYPNLEPGGHGKPSACLASSKVVVVIPYRDRDPQLRIFLHNMHSLLRKQQLDYAIIVVEEVSGQTFNRAKLMNVGYVEAMKLYDFQCAIFHDVDLLPEDDRNLYTCPEQPRHMSVAVDKFNYK